jgi:TetR/AcrR family transcriptional regulator, transcriptional repressor of bet genes
MPRLKQKNIHSRQRQRLIDACISALHIYGPSRTTVEKVVAIAKLSPGIVRFYFASKAAMLVASLQFLAAEFEDQVLAPVSRLKDKPVAALQLLVELYLDPELASPRKVSVWYAFWGEASSRQEYYDICGQKDEGFAALVREIIERLIVKSGQAHLDADGIALGLIGVLEMLWQDFAFKDEVDIDRAAAKGRAMAYLRSVFPDDFVSRAGGEGSAGRSDASLSAWTYENPRLYALERDHMFRRSWQFAAHATQLGTPGDFVSNDLGFERVLLMRGADGELRAFRNSCPAAPHALVAPGAARLNIIRCAIHGLAFALDGTMVGGAALGSSPVGRPPHLLGLEVKQAGDLVLVRADRAPRNPAFADHWQDLSVAPRARALPARADIKIAADWKIVAELLVGLGGWPRAAGDRLPAPTHGWSARRYQVLTQQPADAARQHFLAPNHWISLRPDGWSLRQVLPTAPGRCLLRHYRYTYCENAALAAAAEYLAERFLNLGRASGLELAESIQRGVVDLGHRSAQTSSPAVTAFHRQLLGVLPLMGLDAPP